jgi:hypothetical protein
MAAIECKIVLAMCISRLVEFELLLELKFEQKNGTSLVTGFRLWRQYWRQFWGYIFFGGISPSKIGHIAPSLATIQRLSKTRAFLLEKRREGCFVWAAPSLSLARTYLFIALFS